MIADTRKRYKSSKIDSKNKQSEEQEKTQSAEQDSQIRINNFSKNYTDWYQRMMGSKQPHQKFVEHYESASNTLNKQLDRMTEFADICSNIYHPLHKHVSKTYANLARQYSNQGVTLDHKSMVNIIRQIDDLMKHLLASFSELSSVVTDFANKYHQGFSENKK